MKKILLALVAALAITVSFTGCPTTGNPGSTYLTVTCSSTYGMHAGFDSGLGLGSDWSKDIQYKVNTGTYNYYYTLAYDMNNYAYSNSLGQNAWWYNINNSSGYYVNTSRVSEDYAAEQSYNTYWYSDYITISANPAWWIFDGADRDYTLTLDWSNNSILAGNGVPLTSKVLVDDATKKVTQYTSDKDIITITHNKVPTGSMPSGLDMNKSSSETAPAGGIEKK